MSDSVFQAEGEHGIWVIKKAATLPISAYEPEIFEGGKLGELLIIRRDAHFAGIWACTREQADDRFNDGPIEYTLSGNETQTILEGSVTIEAADAEPVTLVAGDMIDFKAGTVTKWYIHDFVKAAFTISRLPK
ncbi:cupin domain-containing protein [Sphingobium nicotianae]|uniref:DUF861 domain-containing protein n=1 Tax=Sphingobium nicotianae TaxID=2782607 RepID=A0A9X1D9V1_9SPHN|nr:DUF861 domain-containing protein [Sphingobium nicotianae]